MDIAEKRRQEKQTVAWMIRYYCRKTHRTPTLCPECTALLDYTAQRVDNCPFMQTKTFCSTCTVHCYRPEMREKIRQVMRFSGPRMLLHHPIMALRHAIDRLSKKKERTTP